MWDWVGKCAELQHEGVRFVVLTIAQVVGSVPREVGAKMIVLENGQFFGTVGGGGLEKNAIEQALRLLGEGGSHVARISLTPEHGHACGGTVEVLFEVMNQKPRVYICGVGHVGQALCRVLDGTPFEVHAVDSREEWIRSSLLPATVVRHCEQWDEFVNKTKWDARLTYVVVLTWTHEIDFQILQRILNLPKRYVGVIGSKRKWVSFRERLTQQGFSPSMVDAVHCPMGLPIGGKSPQEVAISVAAELLQELNRESNF